MKTRMKSIIFFNLLLFVPCLFAQNDWMPTSNIVSGNEYVPALVASPGGTVIASTWSTGLFRTTNDGENWSPVGLAGNFIYDLAIAPDGNFFAFLSTRNDHSIYRSTDDGLTWSQVFNRSHPNNFFNGGGVVFSDSIFVATLSFTLGPTIGDIGVDVVRSTNFGETWQFVRLISFWGFNQDLTILPGGRILATTSFQGVQFSDNFGTSWQLLTSSPSVFTYKITTNRSGDIFLARNSGANGVELLFKSTDDGTTWINTGIIGNIDGGEIESIFIDGNDNVYVAAHLTGPTHKTIYHSRDNGFSWDEIYDGIPASEIVYSLTGTRDGVLFAGTGSSGVYKKIISPVPVELISFTASVFRNDVTLTWQTATETNNSGFEIERCALYAEQEDWRTIGFIEGNGTATEVNSYSFTDENLSSGKYKYRLKQIDFDGSLEYSEELEAEISFAEKFILEQNYPNPFNPATKIKYQIPNVGTSLMKFVQLKVYDILGNEVATLVNEEKPAGAYEVEFNAYGLSSGIYFYRLTSGGFTETKKLILAK